MLKLTDFDAVIFDMDGLVLDTESTYIVAWKQAASSMGYELQEDFCLLLSGLHYQDVAAMLIEYCGPGFDLDAFNRLSAKFWRDYVNSQGIAVKPGFTELLGLLNRYEVPYCLATNSGTANALECLALAGIADVFAIVVTRDHVPCGKPEPDIFFKAAELLQADISRCLVIEDSHAGIVAAARAGALSVFVPSQAQADPETVALCDLLVADLKQLAETIRF
ncbi:MAG: HAD family hydrolase [Methylobacter sp.]